MEKCFPHVPMSRQHNALGSPCLSHPRRQRVSTIYHGSLISLYLCLQTLMLAAGAFQVQGPHEPVVALLGGEAELPCFLLPRQSIKNMKISWIRSLPSQVVHLYEDGRDRPYEAMEEYSGRTELMKNAMYKGMVVLRILNVRPSDNGQYRCGFQHGSFYSDTMIELKVAVLGSHPQFHVEVTKSKQMQVVCTSEGWFPQPKVQWMDSEGAEIPAESETHTQDKGGLFHVTTSLLLREPSQKNLTCSVWNPVLNQRKEERLSTAVAEPISVTVIIVVTAFVTFLIMLILLIPVGLYLNRKRIKNSRTSRCVPGHSTRNTSSWDTTAYTAVPANPEPDGNPDAPSADRLQAASPDHDAAGGDPPRAARAIAAYTAKPDPNSAKANQPGAAPTDASSPDQDVASSNLSLTAPRDAETPGATDVDAGVKRWHQSKYDTQEAELRSWIEGLTGMPIGPDFQAGLKDGTILCTLMNKLQPGSVPKINRATQTWSQQANLSNFIQAMASYGVSNMDLFSPRDLFESRDMMRVQASLLALSRKARTKGQQGAHGQRHRGLGGAGRELPSRHHEGWPVGARAPHGRQQMCQPVGTMAPGTSRYIYDTKLGTTKCDNSSRSAEGLHSVHHPQQPVFHFGQGTGVAWLRQSQTLPPPQCCFSPTKYRTGHPHPFKEPSLGTAPPRSPGTKRYCEIPTVA